MKWNHQPASSNSPALPLYLTHFTLALSGIPGSGTFTVSGPLVQPVLACVGEDVQLPCHLSPKMDAREMTVKWVRGSRVVHLYRRGQELEKVQAPAFQGRTKMLREDMAEGKVTVIIHQVLLSDTGRYTCYFQRGSFYNETSFDLHVAELKKEAFSVIGPAQPIQAQQGENVTLSCELSPRLDACNMTVKWFRNQTLVFRYPNGEEPGESQGTEFQGRLELLKQDMAEGKITLRFWQVQVSDSGPYTCRVQSPDNCDEADIELQVAENLHGFQKPLTVTIGILLVFLVSFLLIYFFRQRKLQRTKAEEFQSGQFQEQDREVAETSRDSPVSSEDLHLRQRLASKESISLLEIQEGEVICLLAPLRAVPRRKAEAGQHKNPT
ncbi:butyrophilin-like protein 2 isoform X2 [Petaurus breviceps papuanus]|uniref:butyrophilin-like protein 2 isoform X2 n=1 Tax=Petaurus breviceps papuanus TaxID=3040969 RepID=UPI0036DB2E0C